MLPAHANEAAIAGWLRRTRGVTVPVLMIAAALASSPPPLPGFLNALSSPLQHYGVWAIGLLIMLEDFGIPVPGETILIAGAVYAGAGRLNIVAVGVVGFFAAIIGDNIGFAIGHFGGRALALRWGKYVFLTEERLDKAEAFFDRRGAIVITFARFVEGLRQANGIIAGITGMHWLRFLIFNAIGAALWVGTWVSARLPRRKPHHHDLPLHHAVLLLRAHRAGGSDPGLCHPAPPRAAGAAALAAAEASRRQRSTRRASRSAGPRRARRTSAKPPGQTGRARNRRGSRTSQKLPAAPKIRTRPRPRRTSTQPPRIVTHQARRSAHGS